MWAVIRERQGLSANEAPSRADTDGEAHQRCIVLHAVRPDVPAMNATTFHKAYGDYLYVKLRRWLLDEQEGVRLQAAEHLLDHCTEKRENCAEAIMYNLLPVLLHTLERDESAAVRERVGLTLELLVREVAAQRLMMGEADFFPEDKSNGVTPALRNVAPILASLHDGSDDVTVAGLRVVLACHAWHNYFALTAALIEGGLIATLVGLMRHENTTVQMFACSANRQVFQVRGAREAFLRVGGMAAVTDALASTSAEPVAAEAAEVITLVTECAEGRQAALEHRALEAMLPHLLTDNLTLRVAIFSAAAQITVLNAAKKQAAQLEYPQQVVAEIAYEDERDVLMHLLRLICNLAELPKARDAMQGALPRLAALKAIADGDDVVVATLQQAEESLRKNASIMPSRRHSVKPPSAAAASLSVPADDAEEMDVNQEDAPSLMEREVEQEAAPVGDGMEESSLEKGDTEEDAAPEEAEMDKEALPAEEATDQAYPRNEEHHVEEASLVEAAAMEDGASVEEEVVQSTTPAEVDVVEEATASEADMNLEDAPMITDVEEKDASIAADNAQGASLVEADDAQDIAFVGGSTIEEVPRVDADTEEENFPTEEESGQEIPLAEADVADEAAPAAADVELEDPLIENDSPMYK